MCVLRFHGLDRISVIGLRPVTQATSGTAD
ncbi:hypothetical protein BH24ACT1_BH24ACT1_12410 [soil metagenome]